MVRSAKRMLAAVLAIAMIAAFIPATQENAFAAKAKKPAKVKGVKVTVAKNNKVTITWKKAKNAKKYLVSIKDGSTKLTSTKTLKKLKMTFQGGNAVKYTVKVRGINGKKKGAFSKAVSKKTNDLVKAAEQEIAEAEAAKKAAEDALAEELESADDVGRENQNDVSMHVVYSTTGMLRILDEGSTVTMSEDGQTATVIAKTSSSKTWGKITKLAFVKQTATDEEKDAAAADIKFDDETFYADQSVSRVLTFSIPASKIGKKIPVCRYQAGEWSPFSEQAYYIVLTETERKLYEDLAKAEARAEAAEKALADIQAANEVMDAWAEVPDIDVDSAEDDIADVQAVIDAYDALTDDQKALVSDDVKTEIEAAKAVIAEIEELNAKKAEVITAIKAATPANYPTETNTIKIEDEEYCVMAIDNDANEAKLVKKIPVFNGDSGLAFDANGSYNWADSSIRTFMNDAESGFFNGRDLLYAMSIEKEYKYNISKVTVNDDDNPVKVESQDYTTTDRAVLLTKEEFGSRLNNNQWLQAWDDAHISTWVYSTQKYDADEESGAYVKYDTDGNLQTQYVAEWASNDTINGRGWRRNVRQTEFTANPGTDFEFYTKIGACPVVYVSIE